MFLEGETEAGLLTWSELDSRARAVAAALQGFCGPGDRALLLFPSGLDFVVAFFGCLYARVTAVPVYTPRPRRDDSRLRSIARDTGPAVVLATPELVAGSVPLVERMPELADARWLAIDRLPEATTWEGEEPRSEDLAFLQYTSGSTLSPKGVMVSHGNLAHNEQMIQAAFGQDEESVVVGWLPLYHDMGLIGNVLQPLWSGGRCVLMSPAAFLQRPMRWLEAISHYRATTSGGPNFAYDLCVRRIGTEGHADLDLSSWRVAFNGAEPVRAETMERFAAAFAPHGFRREAFLPCYGLAEATLLVAGSDLGRGAHVEEVSAASLERHAPEAAAGPEPSRRLVSCGRAGLTQHVAIVDPEARIECLPGQVGEIWVSGPSVAQGYWGQPEETDRAFRATLAVGGAERFLRTGDLGFVAGGELFVTGRLKDLIILRGRNHYPQDLERTAEESHPALRPGGGAAFPVDARDEERLVLALEVERRVEVGSPDVAEIAAAVRRALAAEHEVQVHDVVLLRAGALPKTSSGKVRRRFCRTLYEEGRLETVGRGPLTEAEGDLPAGPAAPMAGELRPHPFAAAPGERLARIEEILRRAFSRLTRIEPARIDPERLLAEHGLDSLVAVELKGALEAELGVSPSVSALLEGLSLREVARQVLALEESGPEPMLQPVPGTASGEHPLSWGQRSLWFLYRLAPESAAYNMPAAVRLPAGIDRDALQRALQALVDRHAVLRTTYCDGPEGPVQRVAERVDTPMARVDAAGWSDEELRRHVAAEGFRLFDLERGPVLRVTLFERGAGGDVLLLTVHHIAADLWSFAILVNELAAFYGRLVSGGGVEGVLPPLELSYADFSRWQLEMLAGPTGARLWEHWQARLAGAPPLELPADRARPAVQSYRGAGRGLPLGTELSRGLRALARERGCTLFMVLLAGFQALLARISGQEDFLVGCPTSGRAPGQVGERLTGLIGYFVNPVAMRADLSGEPSVGEWLERVRRTALDAFEHQDFPLALLAERLHPERDAGRAPLVQAMFVLQKSPFPEIENLASFSLSDEGARLDVGGLSLQAFHFDNPTTQFDLGLAAADVGGEISTLMRWSVDLFDAATIDRLMGHFANLLRGMVATPERAVADLDLLSEAELREIAAWNRTGAERPWRDLSLHQLFEAQVERTPEATALVHGEERVTYAELDRRANRLAHALRRHGVGPERQVGVLLDRSPDMVAALLGVLKAGGAYVPLDPAYPADRLAFTAEDARIAVLLSHTRHAAALSLPGARTLWLDAAREEIAGESDRRPEPWAGPRNLAYVLYTSGSTGRPKGVAIEHRSPVEMVRWAQGVFPEPERSGVLAATSICFDLSVFELFFPLACGGTVILAENALALPRLPAAGEVTLINTVPSAMAELAEGELPPGVRVVCLAGEPLLPGLAARVHRHPRVRRLLNLYGPSEDTTYSTWDEVERRVERVTIGRPLANTRVHLVDPRLRRVPVGVPGELCLAGEGLARGYLGRPELTAERFVPDPFGGAGERLYRTGDLARWLPDGRIDYLGRLDHQVKIRGFRIELGEIETALAAHPEVREVVVTARGDLPEGRALVAYLAPQREPGPEAAELRGFLRSRLPEPMVPARYVTLPALPRTPNGKVDRKALPRPEGRIEGGAFVAPRTPTEELVAGIWAELLGVERVGVHDNLFDLGGHSLLAIRFTSRLQRAFGVDLSLREIFRSPTVGGLAERLEAAHQGLAAAPDLVPVLRDGEPLPLSFAQERLWFLDRLEPGAATYNMPVAAELAGDFHLPVAAAALNEVVRRHESLRTTFGARHGVPFQRIGPATPAGLPLVDLSALPGEAGEREAAALAGRQAHRSFCLERGPLHEAWVLRLGDRRHRLLLTIHHAVADGWSIGLLLRELSVLYGAFSQGRPSPLPELALQYADFAVWQREWLAALEAEQMGYWMERLGGELASLDLPTDRPRPAVQTFRGGRCERWLPPALADRLRAFGRREGATLFMTLLAGAQALLARLAGQDDVMVGTPVAGRRRVEVEELIGCFLNTLVLRTDLSGAPGLRELLARVREVSLGAFSHQDVPFEALLARLGLGRDPSRTPLFQVLFNMLSLPPVELSLPGLRTEALSTPDLASKFDMTFYVRDGGGRGIHLELVYNADLFDAPRMEELLAQLESLLEQGVERPDEPVGRLSLVTARGAALLPDPAAPLDASWRGAVHELFAERARQAPERVAVADPEGVWSYGELAEASGRVAAWLSDHGVRKGDPVAIFAHRSAPLVQAILGTLTAGAVFTILDPAYPAARLVDLLRVAAPAAWLQVAAAGAPPAAVEGWLSGSGCPRLELPGGGAAAALSALAGFAGRRPEVAVGPEDLACLGLTSGSTGRPKGILGRHGSLSYFLPWLRERFGMGPDDRFSLLSGLSHDPLQRDIFTPLFLGAAIVAPDPEEIGLPGRLAAWMARERVTTSNLTPAMAQLLTQPPPHGAAVRLPDLRLVMLIGEALTLLDVERIRRLAPGVTCVNLYGATETQRALSFHVVAERGEGERARQVLPLGSAMPGAQLLVLNPAGGLAGVGEIGEICVRSPHLAQGYLGDAALTAERFVTSPFTGRREDRIYRTGDLGRYLPDGQVTFAGRVDRQVKIRGFRIELGEIEAALGRHPAVREAAVIAREEGERRLTAYVVPSGLPGVTPETLRADLRGYLAERLPSYMVPAAFVRLDALPLTPSRKVDYRELARMAPPAEAAAPRSPRPPAREPEPARTAGAEPGSGVQEVVLEIMADLLGLREVAPGDSFFELGGHSLLATQLLARLEEAFGVGLSLRQLFAASTAAEIAALVETKLGRGAAAAAPPPRIAPAPADRHQPFPLTDIQQAYWIGREGIFDRNGVASHRYSELESESFDLERFERAWRRLIDRHDMLRAIVLPDGQQQVLAEVPPYSIEVEDLSGLPAGEAAARLEAIRARMSHQRLPTDRWPLFEIRACRLPGGALRLFFSFDFLLADAWSFRLLQNEMLALYGDPETALPPLELTFRDYVLAEVALRQSERYLESRDYWRQRLATLPGGPELPQARDPRQLAEPRFARRSSGLEPGPWRRLKARGARAGLTPSGLLLAAFSEVLAVWSRSPRFTLVLTLFGRLPLHPQVNDLVGDFTSTILLEVARGAGEPFEAVARRVQERLWADLDHRHFSGVQVLREKAPREGGQVRSATPVVFTSTLDLRAADPDRAVPEMPGRIVYAVSQTPQVLLDHQVGESGGALFFSWDAVEEVFPPGFLDEMFAVYQGLLRRLATDEEAWREPVRGLVPERQLALERQANATAGPLPTGLLHQGFEEQAARRPESPAIFAAGRVISFGELDRRAEALARLLRELGARPNRLVAVVMEKGWEQAAAVFAILRAGAAYLPIDPELPAERIAFLLRHGEVEVALTQSWIEGRPGWPEGIRRIAVDRTEPAGDAARLASPARPEDLAYVIFTSGSTGQPKGVMIDHRGALNTVVDVNQRFAVGPQDRVLALSSLSFDLSVYDLFGPLAVGGAVVLPEPWAGREPKRWAELLRDHWVTLWNSVPALLEVLVDFVEGRGERLAGSLRLALLSGDWIPVSLPDRVRRLGSGVEVVSLGGATEGSIWSILYPIGEVDPAWHSIPYGKPMVNQSFHVLDQGMEPRPVWVPGDLYIGGVGVALGYWRDEERTRSAFVTHPRTGERLYRTGDLGRRLPDGNLEFLGREDFQVKIQGYRIELGEIEWALGQHPRVRSCAVTAVGESRGGKRLVAYVVAAQDGGTGLAAELRDHLAARLPAYMVPSGFVFLESLPLSPTGKVDRKALPAPAATPAEPEAPATASPAAASAESEIARVVCRVMRLREVAPEANLLDLGANSVDLIRIANQLELDLGFRPKLEDFFRSPSVAGLAQLRGGEAGPGDGGPVEPAVASRWTPAGMVLDPLERERFKQARHNLRPGTPGAPGVSLPDGRPPFERFLELHSGREFDPAPIPLARFGGFLSCLGEVPHGDHPKLLYPSAGGLYPVQTYVYLKAGRVQGLSGGIYYYSPPDHRLVPLAEGAELDRAIYGHLVNRPIFDRAAFAIFFIAQADAIAPLYNWRGRDFCLIEAGCMLQLLRAAAPEHDLAVCPVGGVEFDAVRHLFDLGPGHELVHSLIGGGRSGPGAGQASPRSELAEVSGGPGRREPELAPVPRDGELPLSSPQLRLWFLDQLDPGNPAYNVFGTVRVTGALDTVALERALNEIRRRHEVLRTTFPAVDGQPRQVISPPVPVPLPRVSLRGLPPAAREAEVERLAREEAGRPFDLARGPLMRATLVDLEPTEHLVLFTMHHIVSDAWSRGILVIDMVPLYDAFSRGLPSPLPEPAVQYADFAHWQQRWLRGGVLEEQLDYWRRQLAGAPALLDLPTRRERSEATGNQGAMRHFTLGPGLTAGINRLSRRCEGTLFITLLAAYQVLLSALSGQEDIVVGTPITNRRHVETEKLIGFFVNTLVMRADLTGDPTFLEVLARVRDVVLGGFAHQDTPFEQLVDALRPDRRLDHTPIFQVWFVLQNVPMPVLELPGLEMRSVDVHSGAVRHDLKLEMREIGDSMRGSFEYKVELFDEPAVAGLCADFEQLLTTVTERPETRLGELRSALLAAAAARREDQERQLRESRRQSLRGLRRGGAREVPGNPDEPRGER